MPGPDEVVDHFAVLGLGPDADEAAVRRAFRARARDTHPDRGGDAEEFMRVNQAYEALRTPQRRALVARAVREQRRRHGPTRTSPSATSSGSSATTRSSSVPAHRSDAPRAARRLAEQEQDRLVQEFFRSHPDAAAPGRSTDSPGSAGGPGGPEGRGRPEGRGGRDRDVAGPPGRRSRRNALVLTLVAAVGVALAAVLLLPDALPGAVGEWVQVVIG